MKPTVVSPEVFRREAQRRLISTHELMAELGLRARQSIWDRVAAGKLPEPVIVNQHAGAFWDKDDLPDRKETT